MLPQSIRWRLPLTYVGIAFIATLILGAALLATLRGYYANRERLHLEDNAVVISETVQLLRSTNRSSTEIAEQMRSLSFLMQARVRILDTAGNVVTDSGSPPTLLSLGTTETMLANPAPFDGTYVAGGIGQIIVEAAPSGDVMPLIDMEYTEAVPVDTMVPARALSLVQSDVSIGHQDVITFAVSSTPYGFDLAGEVTPGVTSDQMVRLPIQTDDGTLNGYVELSEGAGFGAHIIESVATALVYAGGLALVIAALIGWLASRQITDPVLALTAGAGHMAQGQLHTRVDSKARGELGALATTFNEMAAQVEATVTALRRFVADAAHELHTPLTALRADLELAATETNPVQQTAYIRRAHAQVHRLEVLTNNLLDLSRLEAKTRSTPFQPVDLAQLVRELSETYASRAEQAGVNFALNVPEGALTVRGDDLQLRRAVGNLLDNAIKFTPEGGTVVVSVARKDHCVTITVNDTGIGIPADDLPGLFSRFHRARNANTYPGSGLGLAIIRAIVDAHHGGISVDSAPGATQFVVQLPAA
ncbi:MAG: HAMP domain-containing histidine kinase [Chloroflexi bacterium]|nr:HAMP domain-containing histidine kinase [Chloroflexota bacterium]